MQSFLTRHASEVKGTLSGFVGCGFAERSAGWPTCGAWELGDDLPRTGALQLMSRNDVFSDKNLVMGRCAAFGR
jgi:hypothetical protein